MGFLSGKDGSITCAGNRLAKVASWTLSSQVEALETTSLADTARDYTAGIKSANGSCAIWYYDDAPESLLSKVVKTGEATDADIVEMTLGFGPNSVSFKALITNAELAMAVGQVMQAQLQFNVCGDMTGVTL